MLHLFGALAMVFGLLLPLTGAGQAMAAPTQLETLSRAPSQDIDTADFAQVAAIGDFQGQFGCNGFDINCPATQLTNHNGLWTGVFPIPAGQWQWQIAAMTQDGRQITLSDSGLDQTGSLSIGEDEAGAWFSFSAPRQEADASAVEQLATLSTDIGTFALEPDSGNYTAILQSQGGTINAELQLDGTPVGNPQVLQLERGASEVTVDVSGNVVNVQGLGYATLAITRTDGATGQPLPGGCYEVRDNSTVISRGCDLDDGAADGSLTLAFPEGLQPGSYTVAEVTVPDGAEQAPDQEVDLQQTDNVIEIVTGEPAEEPTATEEETTEPEEQETPAEPEEQETPTEPTEEGGIEEIPGEGETEEPTEIVETPEEETGAPGDLIITLQDEQGNPIGGACFQLIDESDNVVAESCDINDAFPYNGNTGFFGVPSGTYTLHQSGAPEGSEPIEDQPVQIPAGDEQDVTVTAPAPEETPTPLGDIVVLRQDAQGNPVGGACFQLIDEDGQTVGDPVCDEDGDLPDDGRIGFFDIPEGTYTLRETRTPEGYEQAPDTQIVVNDGQVTEQAVQGALIPEETPTEEVTQEATEEGTEEATAEETEEATAEMTQEATAEEETETPEQGPPGDLIVTLHDQQGNPIGGACFELQQDDTVIGPICDSDDPFPGNGNTGFFGVPSGTYTLHQTTVPEGTQPIDDQQVEVPANDGDTVIVTAPAPSEPTAEATEEETGEVTPEETEASTPEETETEEPASPPSETEGEVVVDVPTDAATQQVCVELNTSGGISMLNAPEACNTDTGDPDQIVLPDVPEGTYALLVTAGPDDLINANAEPQEIDVEPGQTSRVTLQQEEAPTGNLPVIALDENDNPLPGVCWTLTNDDFDSGELCDNGENGGTPGDGQVQFENVPTGTYTLTETTTPDDYQTPDPQEGVQVDEGDNERVEVRHQLQTGTLTITTTNEGDTPLGGACYAVDEGDEVCAPVDSGTVTIENIPVGNHTVVQTTAPDGYQTAEQQTVEMVAEGASLTFQNAPLTGSIIVEVTDPDSNPVAGLCASVDGGEPVCDNEDADADDTTGTIRIDGVAPGTHDLQLTNIPDEFEVPDGETADVAPDGQDTVRFELTRKAPTTGVLDVTVLMNEEPVPGVCVMLTNEGNEQLGPFCDGGEDDANGADGVIGIQQVPFGSWVVSLAPDTDIEGGDVENADMPSVTVAADQLEAEALIQVPRIPTTGTVRIETTDGSAPLTGACYDLTMGGSTISVCDNDDTDNDGTDGVIEILDVTPGTWAIAMTTAPDGYEQAADTTVDVSPGKTSIVEVTVTPIPQPGSLEITKVDEDGDLLGGACFMLRQGGRTIEAACDDDDDGLITIDGLDDGTYQLVETRAPSSAYQPADPQAVTIEAGQQTKVTVTNTTSPGRLTVITVKDSDRSQRLENACYLLEGDTTYGPFCDADDGTVDGRVHFSNVVAGEYTLEQTVAVPGYDPAGDRTVTIQAGGALQVTVANKATPVPKDTGALAVIPLDENGKPVPGGCYQVFDGDTPITGRVCDNADDVDARITFKDLPVGTFTVRELLAPSPDFVMAADQEVTIRKDETTEVEIPHKMKDGRVLVQAVNSLGQPLQGACFELTANGSGADCTGTTGDVLFNNVPAGKTSLTTTQAPHGYKLDETPRDVTVYPGQTTVIRVTFETAPPPDSGSVQVQKFYCPAGDEGERTQFLGGAEGNTQLSKTAGCTQGVASFTLAAQDAPEGEEFAFKTGEDGRYQMTVKKGIYILTETDPTLGNTHAARLRVGVGQMTTVIVINYVAPPKPAPTNIDVTSFTCPPSFNGTSYADFAASCTSEQAKTNNLTVRVEGAEKFKRVTGDKGKLGQTTFENIPAGKYVVYGDKPYNVPIMYLFCGVNAADPSDVKAINGTVPVSLEGGQTITCQFFLVPEQLSKDTGAIMVQKFSCPIDKPAKGYDWANECERSTMQVPFSLGVIDKETEKVQPLTEIQANPDGIVRFTNLAPGTYKLEEVGGKWCFAQSNSVDAKGNVVVNPNRLSEVWIYNCVGAHQPPNTGSGDAAPLLDPASGNTGGAVLLNVAWPVIALAAWLAWRQRHGDPAAVIVRRDGDRAA